MTRYRRASFVMLMVLLCAASVGSAGAGAAQSDDVGLSWASFGDSYAAGEGLINPTHVEGDPIWADCQRALANDGNDSTAWAAQVAATHASPDHYAFVACTGAITDDLFPGPAGRIEADQLDQARSLADTDTFDVVTVSMGGNNIGFDAALYGCAGLSITGGLTVAVTGVVSWLNAPWVGCTQSEEEMKGRVDALTDITTVDDPVDCANLGDATSTGGFWDDDDLVSGRVTVPEFYDVISQCVVEPGGVVVVMGYPFLIEESGRWQAIEGNRCHRIRRADAGKLRGAGAHLNARLREAVEWADARSSARFVFVDPNQFWEGESYTLQDPSDSDRNSRGNRHALCGGGVDWLNGLTVGLQGDGVYRIRRSFHPNQLGHDAMAKAAQTIDYSPAPPQPVDQGVPADGYETIPGVAPFPCHGTETLGSTRTVIDVASDDVLNARADAGTGFPVVQHLGYQAEVYAFTGFDGETLAEKITVRSVGASLWVMVELRGPLPFQEPAQYGCGWVNARFLSSESHANLTAELRG